MTTLTATVRNEYGIHCRPSAVIAKEAQAYSGVIKVSTDGLNEADARSVLSLVGLAMKCGTTVSITVSGADEEKACRRMAELFETNFDFPREN